VPLFTSCREGVFSETQLPVMGLLGNPKAHKHMKEGRGFYTSPRVRFCQFGFVAYLPSAAHCWKSSPILSIGARGCTSVSKLA
jgi:hypothetical protein